MISPRNRFHAILLTIFLVLTLAAIAQAQPANVAYTVSLTSPQQHLMLVQIILPAGSADRELQLPVWNALYQIRDFAQFVNWVRAKDRAGKKLSIRELNSSRWQIHGTANGAIVDYQIYADSPGPFGAQLNPHHAFLNLAQVLMYPVDARNSPLTVRFTQVPRGWQIATPLPSNQDTYSAENYDHLVDSPVEISDFHE